MNKQGGISKSQHMAYRWYQPTGRYQSEEFLTPTRDLELSPWSHFAHSFWLVTLAIGLCSSFPCWPEWFFPHPTTPCHHVLLSVTRLFISRRLRNMQCLKSYSKNHHLNRKCFNQEVGGHLLKITMPLCSFLPKDSRLFEGRDHDFYLISVSLYIASYMVEGQWHHRNRTCLKVRKLGLWAYITY